MNAELCLGGWMPSYRGLRHIPVNAKAMDYRCVLFDLAVAGGQPTRVLEKDVVEFAKMMRGVECYVQLPSYVNPVLPETDSWDTRRAYFLRFFRTSALLGAKAVLLEPPKRWTNGKEISAADLEERIVEFFSLDLGETPLQILFRTSSEGLGNPMVLERVLQRLVADQHPEGRFGLALDPCRLAGDGEILGVHEVETYLKRWGRITQLTVFPSFDSDCIGIVRRLWRIQPIVLELHSLAEQAEAADYIRAAVEETDLLSP